MCVILRMLTGLEHERFYLRGLLVMMLYAKDNKFPIDFLKDTATTLLAIKIGHTP